MPIEISLQGAYMAGLKVERPVFAGGKILAANKIAGISVKMAKDNIKLQKMNKISEVDSACWIYVSVQEKVQLAQTSVNMLSALLKRVQNSYNAGLVNQNEVLKVQVEYNKATLDLQKAKSGRELARMSLCRVTGLSFETPVVTDSIINCFTNLLSQLGNEDVTQRPEYQLLERQVALEEQKIKTIRADYLPSIGVSVGYNYIGGIKFNGTDYNQDNLSVMGSVKIPLFNWGEGKQKVVAAKASKEIKELELAKNSQLLQLEIEKAKLNLQDASFRIQTATDALQQAVENLRISNNNYEVGRELMTDLLIARTQWEKAYNEVIEAKTEYKLQETEYLRVTSSLH